MEAVLNKNYVHSDDFARWFQRVLQVLWESAETHVHPTEIRPFMNEFQARVKTLPLPTPSERPR